MRTSWCIEQDRATQAWSWREFDDTGTVTRVSEGRFVLFMDAFDDAKMHGCTGMPSFEFPRKSL